MKVANSYKNYTFDFANAYANDKGKLVVNAKCRCNRCNGSGIAISHIENGQPIPYVNDNGICYACKGIGYFYKTIRVYTDEEFEKMERANAKATEKKAAARDAKMKAEFADKRAKWLMDNGFNADQVTYVYFPADSYDLKEELKDDGFKFNPNLFWHIADVPEQYADKCVQVLLDDVAEIGAWGTGNFKSTAKAFVEAKMKAARPVEVSTSEWVGEEKERLYDMPVVLKSVRGMETKFGYTQLVTFETKNLDKIVWWTTVDIQFNIGDEILLTGTVKSHEEFRSVKQTTMTRCKLKGI